MMRVDAGGRVIRTNDCHDGACWSECATCDRQLPTLDPIRLARIGWEMDPEGLWFCPVCADDEFQGDDDMLSGDTSDSS